MKMLILGAGATAFSQYANPSRRPPLLNKEDFLRIFQDRKPNALGNDFFYAYCEFFEHAVELYEGKIEDLFTDIFILSNSSGFDDSDSCNEKINELKIIAKKYIRASKGLDFENILSIFSGILFEELELCIGSEGRYPIMPESMPICNWHRQLAKNLNENDVVVNFNYDLVMPYALLNENKLSPRSFLNSYIMNVKIPERHISHDPVFVLNPHGSFTWYLEELKNYVNNENICNLSENFISAINELQVKGRISEDKISEFNAVRVNINLSLDNEQGLFAKLILPLKQKKLITASFPLFRSEYELFLEKLKLAKTVFFIGKQFKTADIDIANDIKKNCSLSQKEIVYVNPDSKNSEWLKYHNEIFNAVNHVCYANLEEYIAKQSS